MNKISNSWALVKQSFAILSKDEELMLLPILSAISCILVSASVLGGGALYVYPQVQAAAANQLTWRPSHSLLFGFMFVFYLVNYFVIIFFNTALVSAASVRLGGGKPTLGGGLQAAWRRLGVIFQWALVAATVGMILRMIEERSGFIGRLVVSVVGMAWTLATFFVVPVLVFEDLGPVAAVERSMELFRKNWGEEVVGTFSFGLIFIVLALPGIALPILGAYLAGDFGATIGATLMVVYFVVLAVVNSAARGIFMAAVYRYATSGEISPGFSENTFSTAWRPKSGSRNWD